MWEARKIWGGIVNGSRAWGSSVKGFVTDQFADDSYAESEIHDKWKILIFRHIAWLYTLRRQLLIPTPWEHISQSFLYRVFTRKRIKNLGTGLYEDELAETEWKNFLSSEECALLSNYQNPATQLIDMQSMDLKELRSKGLIDDFRHMELQKLLNEFYTLQGKCERIKKFPLPRQYGNSSIIFVGIFIFLLPLGMISEFSDLGRFGAWLSVPFTIIVGWVYLMMELIGDYSENPFEGMGNDIPMLSLCRTIEIDLKEMLKEDKIPGAIQAKKGVLM